MGSDSLALLDNITICDRINRSNRNAAISFFAEEKKDISVQQVRRE